MGLLGQAIHQLSILARECNATFPAALAADLIGDMIPVNNSLNAANARIELLNLNPRRKSK